MERRNSKGANSNGKRSFKRPPWFYMNSNRQKKKGAQPQDSNVGNNQSANGDRDSNKQKRRRGHNESSNDRLEKEDNDRNEEQENQPKRKRRNLENIKSLIISEWQKKMPGYSLYYSKTPPQIPEFEQKVNAALDYLLRNGYSEKNKVVSIEEKEYFDVMYESVNKDPVFKERWSDFSTDLLEEAEEVLNIWGLAMFKIVHNKAREQESEENKSGATNGGDEEPTKSLIGSRIQAGIMKLGPITPLAQIKSSQIGKFITIRGAVVRMGNIRPFCTNMTFMCKICEDVFSIELPEGKYTLPVRCGVNDSCDNTSYFEAVEDAVTTKMVNARRIRIQDMQCSEVEPGSVPRSIDCELFNSIVDRCSAGNAVTLTGIVKMSKEVQHGGDQSLHKMYLEVVAVRNHKDSERTMGGHWFSFSNKDYYAIKEIHDTDNLFRLLITSLCPSIYGHEIVKAGLLLCLFGGTSQVDQIISRRSDINMLMVGDPGIGKSQMLKIVTEVAPRGVYVCGNGSTIAGLTVTMVKDGSDYTLEAGALVMADKGCCCIDEFDKMQSQHHALLEAMEQQSISIAKSGAFRTIPARATVIAAANPVGGHYDKTKSVNENIKINSALMSRFDLIFILLDKPDQEFDGKMIEHIMGSNKNKNCSSQARSHSSTLNEAMDETGYIPLLERIKFGINEEVDLIPHSLIRKYIAYAKQYVKPKISPEAAVCLKEYYLRLRVKHRLIDSTPVTTRQLESLVRLTEARAKLELREVATADDAKDVLDIFESSLSSAFDDEVIAVSAFSQSFHISTCGSNKSQANKANAKRLVSSLQKFADQQSKNLFTIDEIRQIAAALGLRNVVDSLVASLNNEGFLLNKGAKTYQLQSIDF